MDTLIDWSKLPVAVTGMSNQAYHGKREFDGRSFLHAVMKGGGEAQLWMDKGYSLFGGNSATTTGSEFDALLTGIMEGKNFDDLVVIPPEDVLGKNGSRSTTAYKEWAAKQTGICATEETRWKYKQMYESILENEAAYSLLTKTTRTQLSVFFEAYGHKLKVRPDACTETLWWDLKTTSSSWDKLFYSVRDYGYCEQAWLYTEGAKAVGYDDFDMPFVFVQTVPPYRCRVRTMPRPLVERAGRRMISVMEDVRLRRSTGVYLPEDSGEMKELEVPEFAMRDTEEVVTL